MSRPVLLDVFSCAGGAAAGYNRAGFQVVGVDKDEQPRYPHEHHVADAIEVIEEVVKTGHAFGHRIAAVHTSPPCQRFTAYGRSDTKGWRENYLDLVEPTRDALIRTGLPYVIENVPGSPLIDPIQLCGSSFHLDVRRHRLFESNVPLMAVPCDHSWQTPRFAPASNRTNLRSTVEVGVWRIPLEVQRKAMGIDWMELAELSEAIPPAYTEHIGLQLMAFLVKEEV